MNGFLTYISTHFEEDRKKIYENHLIKFKKLLEEFNDSKIFSCEKIDKQILPLLHEFNGVMGMVYFRNDKPRTKSEICDIFAEMHTHVDMAFYKELGPKGKIICNCCNNAFDEDNPETLVMLRINDSQLGEAFICHNCRRAQNKKLSRRNFIEAYKNPLLRDFIKEECALGLDYSKELEILVNEQKEEEYGN